jgi:hypothetical protein
LAHTFTMSPPLHVHIPIFQGQGHMQRFIFYFIFFYRFVYIPYCNVSKGLCKSYCMGIGGIYVLLKHILFNILNKIPLIILNGSIWGGYGRFPPSLSNSRIDTGMSQWVNPFVTTAVVCVLVNLNCCCVRPLLKTAVFQVVLCNSPEEVLEHVDPSQLTFHLGGKLVFDANEWTQHRAVSFMSLRQRSALLTQ